MKRTQITGNQAEQYVQDDYELQLMFPVRPCLIKELLLLAYKGNGLIVMGIDGPRPIEIEGSRDEVLKLINLLDGTKTADELKTLLPAAKHKFLSELQALFFWQGLLQDGPISQPEQGSELLASFLGRYLNLTRTNRNRREALQRLRQHRLAIYAPAVVLDKLDLVLQSGGLGAHLLLTDINDLAGFNASFFLVVADGSEAANQVLQFAHDTGTPCLLSTIGRTETRIGPLILPGLTAGHDCVARQSPAIEYAIDEDDLVFWAAFALQETILQMAGIATISYSNRISVHHYDHKGRYSSNLPLARLPGSKTSALLEEKPLDLKSSAFQAWRHHCITRIPPKNYLTPAAHFGHYSAYSLGAKILPVPPEYGSAIYELPDLWELPSALPWLDSTGPNPKEFNAVSVGNLLRIAVGYHGLPNQGLRISPTGGGLKSAGFFVRTHSVTGIEDGWHAYNPSAHALEIIPNWDPDAIATVLPPFTTAPPPLIIVVVSSLQRVREKYQDFSYNIVHLDAGVATAFASLVANSYGWQTSHHPNVPISPLAHCLGIDNESNYRIISNIFSVKKAPAPRDVVTDIGEHSLEGVMWASRMIDPPAPTCAVDGASSKSFKELLEKSRSRSFEEVLKSRRAHRSFKQCSVRANLVEDLVRVGHQAMQRLLSEGMLAVPFNIYILRVLGDEELASGTYETGPGEMDTWKCISSPFTAGDLNQCLNQDGLAKAPLLFVAVGDLNKTFRQYGAAGYRHLLNQCGFVLGQVWLAAHAAGLVGTMCGGVLDGGMRKAINSDGYTKASMVGFVVGEPELK